MEVIKVKEALEACKGQLLKGEASAQIKGVFIDSRKVKPGGAFFALKGERVDGHDYIDHAIDKGCHVIFLEKEPKKYKSSGIYIKVESTEKALGDLAQYYLSLFNIKKIAVTGSTGKTTTKEMLFEIGKQKYQTVSNEGNLNNLIGLPLTAFKVDNSTELAIFEMGMDRLGEIHRLAEIVKPQIAIITNIGLSHLERLGSRENILKAKGEIRDFLGEEATLIIPGDDEMMKSWDEDEWPFETIKVGRNDWNSQGNVLITDFENRGEKGTIFTFVYKGYKKSIELKIPGKHNVMNAGMALTAALKVGVDMNIASAALADFTYEDKRLDIIKLKDFKIIDDTYNASPDSVKAAIDVLSTMADKRKIAILGDMYELGEDEEQYHREIGEYASQKAINVVLSVGEKAEEIAKGAREKSINAFHFKCKDMLIEVLSQWIRKDDVILVKGSRGMAMEDIVSALKEMKIN